MRTNAVFNKIMAKTTKYKTSIKFQFNTAGHFFFPTSPCPGQRVIGQEREAILMHRLTALAHDAEHKSLVFKLG